MTLTIPMRVLPHGEGLPLPARQTAGAAGYDLRAAVPAASPLMLAPGAFLAVPTGIALAVPSGFEGQVRPRSGLAARFGVTVLNSPGTVDSDYRGEIQVVLINHGPAPFTIARGDRIAQIVIAPVADTALQLAAQLEETDRGSSGFGSTGSAGGL